MAFWQWIHYRLREQSSEDSDDERYRKRKDLPWDKFLNTYLPFADNDQERPAADFSTILPRTCRQGTRISYIQVFQTKLRNVITKHQLCPNFQFVETERLGTKYRQLVAFPRNSQVRSDEEAWSVLEFFVVVTAEVEPKPSRSFGERELRYAFGQHERQPRTFALTLFISGRHARLLRYDRSGFTTTTAINYVRDPASLIEFFWRYNHLSQNAEARGFDPTVALATPQESRLLTEALRAYLTKVNAGEQRLIPYAYLTVTKPYPAYRVHISHDCDLIVRRPIHVGLSHESGCRGTLGCIAYNMQKRRLVFLKDFWENQSRKKPTEPEMYWYLHELHIPHLPQNLFSGSVLTSSGRPQITRARHEIRRVHSRTVQELYFPLSAARSSKELVQVVRDALEALNQAYLVGNVYHGDISIYNIMMTADGRGILNDWDISYFKGESQIEFDYLGTENYMSCEKVIEGGEYRHCLKDDIESCFWVLFEQAREHFMFEEDLAQSREEFDATDARARQRFLEDAVTTVDADLPFPCTPLYVLVSQFAKLLGTYYISKGCLRHPLRFRYCNLPADVKPDEQTAEENMKVLEDASVVLRLFDDALARDDWVEDDHSPGRGKGRERRSYAYCFSETFIPRARRLAGTEEILRRMPLAQDSGGLFDVQTFPLQHQGPAEDTCPLVPPLSPIPRKMVVGGKGQPSSSNDSPPKRAYIGKRLDVVPIPRERIKKWKEDIDYYWFRKAMRRAGGARIVLRDREKYLALWREALARKYENRGALYERSRHPLDPPSDSDYSQ